MSLLKSQQLFTRLIAQFIKQLNSSGYQVTFGEAHRPQVTQDYYLKKGLTKVRHSKHQDRLAIELYVFRNGKLLQGGAQMFKIGMLWEDMHPNCIWGGDWNRNRKIEDEKFLDVNHFEFKRL